MTVAPNTIRVCLEELIADRASRHVERAHESDFYVRTYPLQVAESAKIRNRDAWTTEDVLMRFCSVYGWMPRGIQKWDIEAVPRLVGLLNEAEPDAEELIQAASKCINNSIVGASKFLHFFDPNCYPIFDSVVASLWWPEWSAALAVPRYFDYWEGVVTVGDEVSKMAQAWAKNWMGYDVSGIRAIEALAFYAQREKKKGLPPATVTQSDEDA